tara:strand:- start:26 stop:397 length:372 start_codon:yes stop_codon:yes gene_type:complete
MKLLFEHWRQYLNEGSKEEEFIKAGKEACTNMGHGNCKLFMQTLTDTPDLDSLPAQPYTDESNLNEGDILKWGEGLHYAMYIGDGKVMHVEEWGMPMSIAPLSVIIEDMDIPDVVITTKPLKI